MTPEDRLTKIENLLYSTAQQQARQQEQLRTFGDDIERQNDGIRSLIVVARTCLDSIKEMRETHDSAYNKLVERQSVTDEKLHILIDTVDRIIRRQNPPEDESRAR